MLMTPKCKIIICVQDRINITVFNSMQLVFIHESKCMKKKKTFQLKTALAHKGGGCLTFVWPGDQ